MYLKRSDAFASSGSHVRDGCISDRDYSRCFPGATDYTCFPSLLKQLVGPLTQQLSDRRSSIVKQVCAQLYSHLEYCTTNLVYVVESQSLSL